MILEIKKVTLPELPFLRIDVQLNAFLFYIQRGYYTIKKSRTQVLFCVIYHICWKKESFPLLRDVQYYLRLSVLEFLL